MKQCLNNCLNCKYHIRCGGCSFCEALICNQNCKTCATICFSKKNLQAYLETMDIKNIKLNKNRYLKLPENMPIIPFKLTKPLKLEFAAVHGASFLSRNGEKINKRYLEKGLNRTLNIAVNTKYLLEFYIKDRQLEGFWDKRKSLYRDLKKFNFNYVISPNFSIYSDSTRIEHLYNIKRSSIVYNELLANGINAIVDISWFNKKDLDQWIEAINNQHIKIISFSFQNVGTSLRASNLWKNNLLGLKYLVDNIHFNIDIVIIGIVSPFRVIEIYKTIGKSNRIIILNQSAFIQSRKGILSENYKALSNLTFDEILAKNVDYYNKIYTQIYKSSILSDLAKLNTSELFDIYLDLETKTNLEETVLIKNFVARCLRKKRI